MNSRLFVVIVLSVALVMCRREAAPNVPPSRSAESTTTVAAPADLAGKKIDTEISLRPPVASDCRVGTKLDANGLVAEKQTTFKRREPVYVSLWLKESPEGLAVSVRALDADRNEVARVQKPAAGAKTITLRVEKLKAGKYVLESLWGGNVVCEDPIEVR
ncbi:MAG TPA: hypothetical protein VNA69_09015 [Thermoanaerobaculia bacterium]|nr:hypothetical protein [Thermoanaerobaculia bacterium]